MKSFGTLASLCALATTALAVDPVVVQGQEFVVSTTGKRFMMIGVDYQPGGQAAYGTNSGDPLSNGTLCLRDAALMQQLGVNTIRSYNVDPTLNHDECVSIFNAVGIYILLDVNTPLSGQSIDRSNPSGSYTSEYLTHIFTLVEAFKGYPNLLGFFGGNEVINDMPTAKDNPPYIRAVQRDLKNYIANHADRAIPVGYSAAQVQEILQDTWAYLQCNNGNSDNATADMSRSDFFGLNSYSWCGADSSFTTSQYNVLVDMFGNSTIPVFFSEYGCNDPLPRYFDEVTTIYGPQMTTLSGGLVYEFTEEGSHFGLVQTYDNGSLALLPDFNTLLSQYNKLNVTLIESSNSTATSLDPPKCDASLISDDGFGKSFDIPSPPDGAEELISNGVSNPPTGSIVSVTQTEVQLSVYATDGAAITGLKITPVAEANAPGKTMLATATGTSKPTGTSTSTTSASGSASGSGAAASTSSTGAAMPTGVRMGGAGAVAAAMVGAAMML